MMKVTKKSDDGVTSVVFAGVGGQGVLLVARVLSEAALRSGLDVKSSEVHGMAQRGGSVLAQVRFGGKVYSPLTPEGQGDYLLAFEELEALRYRHRLKKGARVILQLCRIFPAPVASGGVSYPENAAGTLHQEGFRLSTASHEEIDAATGSIRFANIYLLGMLSGDLGFKFPVWEEALAVSVPERFREVNWKAFVRGREKRLSPP